MVVTRETTGGGGAGKAGGVILLSESYLRLLRWYLVTYPNDHEQERIVWPDIGRSFPVRRDASGFPTFRLKHAMRPDGTHSLVAGDPDQSGTHCVVLLDNCSNVALASGRYAHLVTGQDAAHRSCQP